MSTVAHFTRLTEEPDRTMTRRSPVPANPSVGEAAVELRDVSVQFGSTTALEKCNLTVHRGECLALLGPSGSGKSTALNCIAGFLTPTTGTVHLDGKDVTRVPPAKRGLGFVVQSYALFPHMSVWENIAFGLKARRMPRADIRQRVEQMAELVGMGEHLGRKPSQLSGGQQQRVAIARALAIRPSVLLLDEPTSALDTRLRETMLDELRQLRRELPDVAMIVVTHDQNEAMALADRIALLRDGRCEAWDTVPSLFYEPPTEYTATFLGNAGILPGRIVGSTDPAEGISVADGGFPTPGGSAQPGISGVLVDVLGHQIVARVPAMRTGVTGEVLVAMRPWHWALLSTLPTDRHQSTGFTGTVHADQWRGGVHRYQVVLDGMDAPIPMELPDTEDRPRVGETITVRPQDWAGVIVAATVTKDPS